MDWETLLAVLHLGVTRDGDVYVSAQQDGYNAKRVPLEFDPVTRRLVSTEDEQFLPAEAGERRAKRSALAEVVQAALEIVKAAKR